MTSPCCGIDFGTSNSTVGLANHAGARLVALEGEAATMPSALFFGTQRHDTLFGRAAMAAYVEGEEGRLLRALKSVLGTSLMNEKTRIRREQMSFADILGLYIRNLKRRAEAAASKPIDQVVMGRPVWFVDHNEAADKSAQTMLETIARSAGFNHVEFQYEPIAAALDYEQHLTHEDLVLIVDIGGGTSDFSLIRVSPERAKAVDRKADILGNGGVHIGGTDFDRLLSLKAVMPAFGYQSRMKDNKRDVPSKYYHDLATWHRINFLYNAAILQELREVRYEASEPEKIQRMMRTIDDQRGHDIAIAVESAKIILTNALTAPLTISDRVQPLHLNISRPLFEDAITESMERIGGTIDTLLRDAGVKREAVRTTFLTGGSAALPLLQKTVEQRLPAAKLVMGDALGSVGTGLALDSFRRFGG